MISMKFFNKQIRGWLIAVLIVLITLEFSPIILSPLILKQSFSRNELLASLRNEILSAEKDEKPVATGTDEYLGDHILHPYLGFVSIPQQNYNEFCFPGTNPVTKKADDRVHLVIMGGSVAKDIYSLTGERIINNLKKSDMFNGKQFDITVFALGGFKQPQQLMALNYFMALGAEYDIVINIDGFNEIVLPWSDNLPYHIFPSYPRHWNIYSRKKLDSKVILLMGKQSFIKNKIDEAKRFLASSILRNSNFILFLWKVTEFKSNRDLLATEDLLRKSIETSESDYQSTGIYTTVSDTLTFMKEQAEFWARSSQQIAIIARSAGFEYFHFLQPNQYVEGSKTLTRKELEIAYESNEFSYKDAVRMGYPMLRESGKLLKTKGTNFTDLTDLFINEKRTVYNDKCCHLNQLGYDIIADKICSTILNQTMAQSGR